MITITLFDILKYMNADYEFTYSGSPSNADEYTANFVWYSSSPQPSWEDIQAALPAAKAAKLMQFLREERNALLFSSDWTQMPDAQVDKDAWAEYRQALRDLPENTVDPENPVWPTPPA